jgi:Zn-finger nucleic acid-binding protein
MNPCPRCNLPLSSETHGDIVMEHCDRCGGWWMDPDDLKAILDTIQLPVEGQTVRAGVDLTGVQEDAPCPRCGVPMEPFNYAGDSGILLDRCRSCGGLWLDGGDLERVLQVVSAAKQEAPRDAQRFSADLEEEAVRQDALEQQDGRPVTDPLAAALASRIADTDTGP